MTAYQQAAGQHRRATSPAVDAVPVLIKRLDPGLPLPARAHPGDAGVDLCTAVDVVLAPGERALVPTGMAIALPEGYAAFVHPRSGLAARHGVTIVNAPGTVDAGYRGEIKVTLLNTDRAEPVRFERGDRIAQLVVQRVAVPAVPRGPDASRFGPRRWRVRLDRRSRRGDGGPGRSHGSGGRPRASEAGGAKARRGSRELECCVGGAAEMRTSPGIGLASEAAEESVEYIVAGPWDVNDDVPQADRIDFGSMHVPVAEGCEVQISMADDQPAWITVVRGDSGLQLQAFAAPKTDGLWADVRQEIAAEVAKAGGQSEEADGPFGVEVHAQDRAAGAGARHARWPAPGQVPWRGRPALVPPRGDQRARGATARDRRAAGAGVRRCRGGPR